MIILHDPKTLLHKTVELLGARLIPAIESPDRIKVILKCLENSEHDVRHVQMLESDSEPLLDLISSTHDAGYIEHLRAVFGEWRSAGLIEETDSILPECFVLSNSARSEPKLPKDIFARAGFYAFDMSSGVMHATYGSILASANLAHKAVDILQADGSGIKDVFALCRPPGHHCDGRRAGGYCYVNNAAVAISAWRSIHAAARIGVLDIDFHHGNGTQEIYYDDPQVFYASIHGEDEFPYYTGMSDERGGKTALGTNLNLPLKTGSSFAEYSMQLDQALIALRQFQPGFLLVSLGFDTFHLDPLGRFKIETEHYEVMAQQIRQRLWNMPAVILLEGGYVLEHLGPNVLSFLRGWEGSEVVNGV